MRQSAPDTRNRIDGQRDLNTKKVVKKITKRKFVVEKRVPTTDESYEVKVKVSTSEGLLSKGKMFKMTHGYSITMHKLMKKHGLDPNQFSDSINAYKAIRKKRKKLAKAAKRAKHDKALAGRRSRDSKKGKK
jgi:hypothetical protein